MISRKGSWQRHTQKVSSASRFLIALSALQLLVTGNALATSPSPPKKLPTTSAQGHWIKSYKNERQIDLEAGQTVKTNVDCQPGDLVVDGSWRIDQSDSGNLHEVLTQESFAASERSYTFTLTNTSDGRAQAKAFVMCLGGKTSYDKGHDHKLESYSGKTSLSVRSDKKTIANSACKEYEVPVAPGFSIKEGTGELLRNGPVDANLQSWNWSFATGGAKIETTHRCLKLKTSTSKGHYHALDLKTTPSWPAPFVTVPGKSIVERSIDCADDRKGIVAFFDVDPYGKIPKDKGPHCGNDPRPKTRAFKLINDDALPISVRIGILCLADRTSKEIK